MKTPRELLLGQHANAVPRLDQIRRDIVDRIGPTPPSFAVKVWQELIVPARRAWACVAAGWVVVLALNLMTGGDASVGASEPGRMNPDSVIALQRQERLMALSIEENTDEPSSPAKPPEPRPRTEADVAYEVV
jgi:hypothetical protein